MNIAKRDERVKRTATTMVTTKMNFSNPRRVWYSPPPSPPPNTPPMPASDCWSKIAEIRIIDNIICI